MAKRSERPGGGGLPSREDILDFIARSPIPVGKREIARAFKVPPAHRVALKGLLKEIERSGAVERGAKRRLAPIDSLPEIGTIEITGVDEDGELLGRPLAWSGIGPAPTILVDPEACDVGDRVVAQLARLDAQIYRARVLKKLAGTADRIVGVFRAGRDGGRVEPTQRRDKTEYRVTVADAEGARDGELVVAEALPARRMGLPQARIIERLGDADAPKAISLVAIHTHGIPTAFPPAALAQAAAAQPVALGERTDVRDVPLVTIDGADARDFDDAVWAEPDGDPENAGGWHVLVAIADVCWYVRPGDALDRAAEERGNSVYFPDRVVPMLPEELSNDLCSLRPQVERACLAAEMWFDKDGRKIRHRFLRGLMRSAARLTYEQAQAATDGRPDDVTGPLVEPVLKPLYGASAALASARKKRGALELDLPERKVVLGEDGKVARIEPRQRLDSHKLIEEFMIAANVAAAETLEKHQVPCMYRVHDAPDPAKLQALQQFLESLGIPGLRLAKGQAIRPRQFNQVLARAADTPHAPAVNELVLRSQAQAVYSPTNIGHFGLALRRYAHFTSPIRRYADLLVHRALVKAGRFGEGALPDVGEKEFAGVGEHISMTERRAAAAERDAVDRYTVAFLAERVGATFRGRVNGAMSFGLFVTLLETGADGLIPIGTLPGDYYDLDEPRRQLVGRRTGRTFTMGDTVTVRLAEADRVTGSLVFAYVDEEEEEGSAAGGEDRRGRHPGATAIGRPGRRATRPKASPRRAAPGKRGRSGRE